MPENDNPFLDALKQYKGGVKPPQTAPSSNGGGVDPFADLPGKKKSSSTTSNDGGSGSNSGGLSVLGSGSDNEFTTDQMQFSPLVGDTRKNAVAHQEQIINNARIVGQNQPKQPQQKGIVDHIADATYLHSFNEGFNDAVVKPLAGANDFIDRSIDKIYSGITGEETPDWLRKGKLLDNIVKHYDEAYANRPKPTNIVSETAEGVIGALPMVAALATGEGEASLATRAPQFFGKATKFFAATKSATAYKQATDEGKDYLGSLNEAAKGGVEGTKEGMTLEAQMVLGGAFGKGVVNKLVEKGVFKGGKAAEAIMHAMGVGTVFAGTSAGEDLANGKDVDVHEAAKQFGMGFAFEMVPTAKAIGAEVKDRAENKKINDSALQAASVSTTASNLQAESALRTFLKSTPEQIAGVNENIKEGHEDLYANSIEAGAKAYETKENGEKKNLYRNQLLLKTQGDIKFVTEKLKDNPTELVNIIDNNDLTPHEKADIIEKVVSLIPDSPKIEQQVETQQPVGEAPAVGSEQSTITEQPVVAQNATTEKSNFKEEFPKADLTKPYYQGKRNAVMAGIENGLSKEEIILAGSAYTPAGIENLQKNGHIDEVYDKILESLGIDNKNITNEQATTIPETETNVLPEQGQPAEAPVNSEAPAETIPGQAVEEPAQKIERLTGIVNSPDWKRMSETEHDQVDNDLTAALKQSDPKANWRLDDEGKVEVYREKDPEPIVKEPEPTPKFAARVAKVTENEPTTVREAIQHFFLKGGKISSDDFKRFTGFSPGSEDARPFISFIKKPNPVDRYKGGLPLDLIQNEFPEHLSKEDLSNEIINVMQEANGSKTKMLDELEKNHNIEHEEPEMTDEEKHFYGQLSDAEREAYDRYKSGEVPDESAIKLDMQYDLPEADVHDINSGLKELGFTHQDFSDYEQHQSELNGPAEGGVPEDVQQPVDDGNPNAQEDSSGKEIQGEQDTASGSDAGPDAEVDVFDRVFDQKDVRPVLDWLERRKFKSEGLNASIAPVVQLYNTGIDIIKSAVMAGNTLRNAIKLASGFLKESGATDKQVERFEKEMSDDADLEKKERTKSLKNLINETTGQRAKNKVVMTELDALKKQMRDFGKGFRKGTVDATKDAKAIQRERVQATKEAFGSIAAQIKEILKDAVKSGAMDGTVSAKTLSSVINKLAKANGDLRKATATIDYVKKVVENAAYDRDVADGNNYRKDIRKQLRSKTVQASAASAEVMKKFLQLNPSKVEDIKTYNDIADKILHNARQARVDISGERPEVLNKFLEISNNDIEKYTYDQANFIEKNAKEALMDKYDHLVDAGIIDPDKMSSADMKEVIKSMSGDTEDEGLTTEEKTAAKEGALRELLNYQKESISDYQKENGGYVTPDENEVLTNLNKIDPDQLNLRQLTRVNDVINNIVENNNFVGSGDVAILGKAITDGKSLIQKLGDMKINLSQIPNRLVEGFGSKDFQFDFITRHVKAAAETQRLSGVSGIFDGYARAKLNQGRVVEGYRKLKKSLGADIDVRENKYRRGILSRAIQDFGGSAEDVQSYFDAVKDGVKKSYERLKISEVPAEQREGALVEKVYNELLEGANNQADVIKASDAINKGNMKLVKYWQDRFEENSDAVQESTELYNNQLFYKVNGYTSTRNKGVNGIDDLTDQSDVFEPIYSSKKVDLTPSQTKQRRLNVLGKERVMDLDFDKVQSARYFETIYDLETSKHIAQFRNFLETKLAGEALGGVRNKKLVTDAIRKSVIIQKGKTPPFTSYEKLIDRTIGVIQAKGARIALGSASQLAKQYASVAVNTMVNLGKDAGLYLKAVGVGKDSPIFDHYDIALRGETQAGYARNVSFDAEKGVNFGSTMETAETINDKYVKPITDFALKALEHSDVAVARHSWLAFYMQDLKRQGVGIDVDWNKDPIYNEEAAAYAQQMVSENQNPNDTSSMPQFYQNQNTWAKIVKNTFLPFSTFTVNQRVRMYNDFRKLTSGNRESVIEGSRSLAATLTEQVAFNSIKTYMIGSLVHAGANAVLGSFGFNKQPNDDETKTTIKGSDTKVFGSKKFKKVAANTMGDFFLSGIGSLPRTALEKGLNSAYSALFQDYYKKDGKWEKSKNSLFFYQYDPTKYGDSDYSPYGLYAVPAQKIEALNKERRYLDGNVDAVSKGGFSPETKEVPMTKSETRLAWLNFIIDGAALAGVGDADVSQMNSMIRSQFQNQMQSKYGGKEVKLITKGKGKY